jgi:hypothetical protein
LNGITKAGQQLADGLQGRLCKQALHLSATWGSHCRLHRRVAELLAHQGCLGCCLQQQADGIHAAGCVQGGCTYAVCGARLGSGCQQQSDALDTAAGGSGMNGPPVLLLIQMNHSRRVCPSFQQLTGAVGMAAAARLVQCAAQC